jgi:hypothetical protein
MGESEQSDFELLVKILDEERETQFALTEHTTPERPVACSLRSSPMQSSTGSDSLIACTSWGVPVRRDGGKY